MATPRAADAPSSATTPASRTRAAGLKFTAAQTSERYFGSVEAPGSNTVSITARPRCSTASRHRLPRR